jgi:hypothetical protein
VDAKNRNPFCQPDLSKIDQRRRTGCDLLVAERRGPPPRRFPQDGPSFGALSTIAVLLLSALLLLLRSNPAAACGRLKESLDYVRKCEICCLVDPRFREFACIAHKVSEALRSRHFWLMAVAVLLAVMAVNGAIAHLVALLTDRGMATSVAGSC